MNRPDIYLDHAASSTLRDEARDAMSPWMSGWAANASGAHRRARAARLAVEDARDAMAEILGASRNDIIFTSGGTESDDLAITGVAAGRRGGRVCSAIEHPAVTEPILGAGGSTVRVGRNGLVDLDALSEAIDGDTVLVSMMTVNNEVGTIQPMSEISEIVRRRAPAAAMHTDAVQALSYVDLRDVWRAVDLLSLSGHKFGGPTGVGLLAARHTVELAPRQRGGGQEQERRGGTLNVAGIVGMAAAARTADEQRATEIERVGNLRDRLVRVVVESCPTASITVDPEGSWPAPVVAGTAHLCLGGIDSEELLFLIDEAGVCASAASACASGAVQRSHVLGAMGVDPAEARGAIRLTLGHDTTESDVDRAAEIIAAAVTGLSERSLSPVPGTGTP